MKSPYGQGQICFGHNFLLNTCINFIFGQAINIFPNLIIDIPFADIHGHNYGHNRHSHNGKNGLFFQIYAVFMTHYDAV